MIEQAKPMTPEEHAARVIDWWAARDERLRDPDGWLTLVGLYWLHPGENTFGADGSNDIALRGRDVPPHAGSLWLTDGQVQLQRAGQDLDPEPLANDVSGEPTAIDLGSLRMIVIERGGRIGLRVRDHDSAALAAFRGMDHFPIDPAWQLQARLEPATRGETIEIVDVTGDVSHDEIAGRVAFDVDGTTWQIAALPGSGDGCVWLVFGDATNGEETYGGGRFLYSEPVDDDGSVVIDFNFAYNPPCVFSQFATCPLPPAENRLPIRIEAGERNFSH